MDTIVCIQLDEAEQFTYLVHHSLVPEKRYTSLFRVESITIPADGGEHLIVGAREIEPVVADKAVLVNLTVSFLRGKAPERVLAMVTAHQDRLLTKFARLLHGAANGGLLGLEDFEAAKVPGFSHEKIVELLDAATQITEV